MDLSNYKITLASNADVTLGNVTTANGVFECSVTSTVGSYSVVRTRHFNPFRPGESMIGRWLTKFDTPAAGTSQRIGLNNQEQGYYIGYNDAKDRGAKDRKWTNE